MEFLDLIIIGGIAGFIGYWVGWYARGFNMLNLFSQHPEKIIALLQRIKEINDEPDEHNRMIKAVGQEVTPEYVNGTWYAYLKDSGQFVGQGDTLEAALEQAKTRFPGKSFWCNKPQEPSQTA